MARKPKATSELAALRAEVAELRAQLAVTPQAAPAPSDVPKPVPFLTKPAAGQPSAFMAYVNQMRGMRAEPVPDDPEAEAFEEHAEKLANMHPIDRQAFLDGLRQKGRRDDLRKERKAADLPDLTDDELDELLGGALE